MNKVILIGHLGKDVESGVMTNGDSWAKISMATSENWKDKDGNKQEKTEWHNLVFYRKLAEVAAKYLKKGSQVCVVGKIQSKKWEDKKTGETKYGTDIVVTDLEMLGRKEESKPEPKPASSKFEDIPDDIPF